MDSLASQIIIEILAQEMELATSRIWIRDQNRKIPEDKDLFVVVGLIDATPMSNVTFMESQTQDAVTTEHQINQVIMRESIQIDIMSRSNEATLRNWEIVAALQSFYSQQQQELNNFKIFRIPSNFLNTSGAEGGSNINRYTVTVPCFVWYRKDTQMTSPLGDYFNTYTTRVDDEDTIGTDTPLVEFTIDTNTPTPP